MERPAAGTHHMSSLSALVLNCTLKPAPTSSSTEALSQDLVDALAGHEVKSEVVRVVDEQVKFGVQVDEGDGDGWPAIREKMLASDIVVVATPIWLGQPSAVCKMVLERLDAELGESDDYQDLDPRPETTQMTTATLASNLAHLARLLGENNYPAT